MTTSHLKSAAIALTLALLLGGCSENGNSAPGTGISEPNYSDETSTTQSESSLSSSESGDSSNDSSDGSESTESSSASSTSSTVEYLTEDDKAVREILSEILPGAQDIARIFHDVGTDGAKYPKLVQNGVDYDGVYYEVTENSRTQPNGLFSVPQTRAEVESLLRRYFTERTIDRFMKDIHPGKFTTDTNGDTVVIDTDKYPGIAALLEIDGKLYGRSRESSFFDALDDIKVEDATVLERSETSIMFHFYADYPRNRIGVILYENGSWKFDCFGSVGFIPEMPDPATFTDEDKELQAILNELSPAITIAGWDGYGVYGGDKYQFIFPGEKYAEDYNSMPVGKTYDPKIEYPQTIAELEELLFKYFTRQRVDEFMAGVCKATMSENSDGTYTVVPEDENSYCQFLEIDGKLYVHTIYRGGAGEPVPGTAQIIEKTDDHIKFSYIHSSMAGYFSDEGLIKYERGGWRMSYSDNGFVLDDPE